MHHNASHAETNIFDYDTFQACWNQRFDHHACLFAMKQFSPWIDKYKLLQRKTHHSGWLSAGFAGCCCRLLLFTIRVGTFFIIFVSVGGASQKESCSTGAVNKEYQQHTYEASQSRVRGCIWTMRTHRRWYMMLELWNYVIAKRMVKSSSEKPEKT